MVGLRQLFYFSLVSIGLCAAGFQSVMIWGVSDTEQRIVATTEEAYQHEQRFLTTSRISTGEVEYLDKRYLLPARAYLARVEQQRFLLLYSPFSVFDLAYAKGLMATASFLERDQREREQEGS